MLNKNEYKIYVILNIKNNINERYFFDNVKNILRSNIIKIIQLRYKHDDNEFFQYIAYKLKKKCDNYNTKLIINDNLKIMENVNADGIHLGQNDLLKQNIDFKKLIYQNKIIGISVKNLEQAISAKKNGAHYLGVGAMFSSKTKKDSKLINPIDLNKIIKNINLPIIAIGGINLKNIEQIKKIKIDGIALISVIENAINKNFILKKLLKKFSN